MTWEVYLPKTWILRNILNDSTSENVFCAVIGSIGWQVLKLTSIAYNVTVRMRIDWGYK